MWPSGRTPHSAVAGPCSRRRMAEGGKRGRLRSLAPTTKKVIRRSTHALLSGAHTDRQPRKRGARTCLPYPRIVLQWPPPSGLEKSTQTVRVGKRGGSGCAAMSTAATCSAVAANSGFHQLWLPPTAPVGGQTRASEERPTRSVRSGNSQNGHCGAGEKTAGTVKVGGELGGRGYQRRRQERSGTE